MIAFDRLRGLSEGFGVDDLLLDHRLSQILGDHIHPSGLLPECDLLLLRLDGILHIVFSEVLVLSLRVELRH